jgi:hypothetical protein
MFGGPARRRLRDHGLPRLRAAAHEDDRPVPALAPRIVLHPTAEHRPDEARRTGEGHRDQIRADLDELRALGATHVLLDPPPDAAARHDAARDRAVVEEAAGWLLA